MADALRTRFALATLPARLGPTGLGLARCAIPLGFGCQGTPPALVRGQVTRPASPLRTKPAPDGEHDRPRHVTVGLGRLNAEGRLAEHVETKVTHTGPRPAKAVDTAYQKEVARAHVVVRETNTSVPIVTLLKHKKMRRPTAPVTISCDESSRMRLAHFGPICLT